MSEEHGSSTLLHTRWCGAGRCRHRCWLRCRLRRRRWRWLWCWLRRWHRRRFRGRLRSRSGLHNALNYRCPSAAQSAQGCTYGRTQLIVAHRLCDRCTAAHSVCLLALAVAPFALALHTYTRNDTQITRPTKTRSVRIGRRLRLQPSASVRQLEPLTHTVGGGVGTG